MNVKLRKKYPEEEFVELPKKHMINNLKSDVVHARQVMLEAFLEDILTKPDVRESSEMVIFLSASDNYNTPTSTKKVTKLKQPQHLRKAEEERSRTLKRLKKEKPETGSLMDIWSKMGVDSLESILPPRSPAVCHQTSEIPSLAPHQELDSDSANEGEELIDPNTEEKQEFTQIIRKAEVPFRIISKPAGRGRGHGRGISIPRPQSPRVIRLRPPTAIDSLPLSESPQTSREAYPSKVSSHRAPVSQSKAKDARDRFRPPTATGSPLIPHTLPPSQNQFSQSSYQISRKVAVVADVGRAGKPSRLPRVPPPQPPPPVPQRNLPRKRTSEEIEKRRST